MMIIRPSKIEDGTVILELRKAMFEDHRAHDPRWNRISIPDDIAGFWSDPDTSNAFCFVAESDGKVVGYIVAGIDHKGDGSLWEASVSEKKKGIGTRLYTTAVDWLIRRGARSIEGTVPFWNEAPFKILGKLGFGEWTRTWRREL